MPALHHAAGCARALPALWYQSFPPNTAPRQLWSASPPNSLQDLSWSHSLNICAGATWQHNRCPCHGASLPLALLSALPPAAQILYRSAQHSYCLISKPRLYQGLHTQATNIRVSEGQQPGPSTVLAPDAAQHWKELPQVLMLPVRLPNSAFQVGCAPVAGARQLPHHSGR